MKLTELNLLLKISCAVAFLIGVSGVRKVHGGGLEVDFCTDKRMFRSDDFKSVMDFIRDTGKAWAEEEDQKNARSQVMKPALKDIGKKRIGQRGDPVPGGHHVCVSFWQWNFKPPYDHTPDWVREAIDAEGIVFIEYGNSTWISITNEEVSVQNMVALPGDYLVREYDGVIRPCDPAKFSELYEFVEKGDGTDGQ